MGGGYGAGPSGAVGGIGSLGGHGGFHAGVFADAAMRPSTNVDAGGPGAYESLGTGYTHADAAFSRAGAGGDTTRSFEDYELGSFPQIGGTSGGTTGHTAHRSGATNI